MGIPVLTDKVDIAHARLEFAGGAVANVTASRVSTERVRKMRFFQQHEYISLDYARRDALRVGGEEARDRSRNLRSRSCRPRRSSRCARSWKRLSTRYERGASRAPAAQPAARHWSWPNA